MPGRYALTQLPEFGPDDDVRVEVVEPQPITSDRSLSRRIALQVLFEVDCAGHDVGQVLGTHLQVQNAGRKVSRYVRELVTGVWGHREALDDAIRHYAPEWPLDQLAIIDRNIMRMAIYEFAVTTRTPVGVAIDEAVELAKLFGAENASSFVNGVLGSLADDAQYLKKLYQPENREIEDDGTSRE